MSIAHRQTQSLASDNGSGSISGSVEDIGTTEHTIDNLFAAGTDTAYAIAFTGSNVQSFILLASQNMTIEVNNGTTPDATITLVAGVPRVYSASSAYYTNPFSGITVANFYITNTSASRLKARILVS